MSAIREKIETRLDELEALMKARNYAEAEELIPSINKDDKTELQASTASKCADNPFSLMV